LAVHCAQFQSPFNGPDVVVWFASRLFRNGQGELKDGFVGLPENFREILFNVFLP
jgi:hypothetical protein